MAKEWSNENWTLVCNTIKTSKLNMHEGYKPDKYWSEVANRIAGRRGGNVIAGDDEPYYRYKRQKVIKWLHAIDFKDKSVLEVGCGPGGNLVEIYQQKPSRLVGVDVSGPMVDLARSNAPENVELYLIDGKRLPFESLEFDIVLTITVLQHNTDEEMLKRIMGEICRVSKEKVLMLERIDPSIQGDELCLGRPVAYYIDIMRKNGFSLVSKEHINIRASYYMAGAIRKGLNPGFRKEGESLSKASVALQKLLLPVTRVLDRIFTSKRDIAKLEFFRQQP